MTKEKKEERDDMYFLTDEDGEHMDFVKDKKHIYEIAEDRAFENSGYRVDVYKLVASFVGHNVVEKTDYK